MRQSNDMASQLNLPILVLYTVKDAFVDPDAVENFYQHIASRDKTKSFYPESYHLLLHDNDKAQVLHTIGAWVRQRAISR
jgi:esterase/lipase